MVIDADEGPRKGTSLDGLAKLKPAFKEGGTTTAGNSSQISDGAAVVLLASREAATRHGLPILARFVDFIAVGCLPDEMGIGPSIAIPKLLERNGLTTVDVAVYEINEAFAS